MASDEISNAFSLESVRDSLIRQEDSIVFALIERGRFPRNPKAYQPSPHCGGLPLAELLVREAEALQAKGGRYQNPEEMALFPDDLPSPLLPPYNYLQVYHLASASASVCVNKDIWDMYFNKFLPLFTSEGDDGNYAATVASDLVCLQYLDTYRELNPFELGVRRSATLKLDDHEDAQLMALREPTLSGEASVIYRTIPLLQALSRRIHYDKHVAEVKFREAPEDYSRLIRAKDIDALMKLLTFEKVEVMVKRRVAKKAMVFGQNVTLDEKVNNFTTNGDEGKLKVDPSVVSRLYADWVMPLTKLVEVEYLLHRLD